MVQNKALVFVKVPSTFPTAKEHLRVISGDFDVKSSPPVGGFTGQVLYASFDPYLRHRMVELENARDGFEPLPIGSVIPNAVIARVICSDASNLRPGDTIIGMAPIQEYVAIAAKEAAQFMKIQNPYNLDLKLFLGALGMPGLTAYSALYEIGKPKKGETIFVSAASGAVGQIVGQLAKREGLRVIGSVRNDEKLETLTKVFKFDAGFNYRKGDIYEQLKKLAPDGIDIYFDNVGGEQLEAAISALKDWGRIVACGYASQYSVPPNEQYGIRNTREIISKRLTWRGLSVFDSHMAAYAPKLQENVGRWISEGSFSAIMCETAGIDNAPQGLVDLCEGRNLGKAILSFGVL